MPLPRTIAVEGEASTWLHFIDLTRRLESSRGELTTMQRVWQKDPVRWVREVVVATPDPFQEATLRAIADGKHVAIRSGHGVGKTAMLSWTVLWYLDTHATNVRVVCAAPTEDQLTDMLWPEMKVWLERSPGLAARIRWKASRVGVVGYERTCFAIQRAAGPDKRPDNLAGFHADHLIYIVDEAAGVADQNMAVITGALSTEGAQLIMTGNPTRTSGYFASRFTQELPLWHVDTVSSLTSPRASKEYAVAVASEWGEESDEYRVRVLGLPPKGAAQGFIPADLVEEAQEREGTAEGTLVVGVDVARLGRDKTAFVTRRGPVVGNVRTFAKLRVPATVDRLIDWLTPLVEADETVEVFVDDAGVGGGVTDLLMVMEREDTAPFKFHVHGVTFGGNGDKWYSTNAGVWWHRMRRAMQEGWLCLPKRPSLYQQLVDRTSTPNARGKVALEAKDHMKTRGVRSPDEADAVALTFAEGGQGAAFMALWKKEIEEFEERKNGVKPQDPVMRPRIFDSNPSRPCVCRRRRWGPDGVCVFCGGTPEMIDA